MTNEGFRTERDSLGELQVPADALWGAQTQRAIDNFQISGLRLQLTEAVSFCAETLVRHAQPRCKKRLILRYYSTLSLSG